LDANCSQWFGEFGSVMFFDRFCKATSDPAPPRRRGIGKSRRRPQTNSMTRPIAELESDMGWQSNCRPWRNGTIVAQTNPTPSARRI
jgi:hypothetical protein